MHAIGTRRLWIGTSRDGRDSRTLYEHGIQAVIDLAVEELPAQLPREFQYFRVPLLDGGGNDPENLKIAVIVVGAFLQSRIEVLVCCGAGLSRSPAVAAFAMAHLDDKFPSECLTEIQSCKPVDISPALWHELDHAANPTSWRMIR